MILCAFAAAILLPVFHPPAVREEWLQSCVEKEKNMVVRSVSAIKYETPHDLTYRNLTFTRKQLLDGKMLCLDDTHDLPTDAPAPNTASIAKFGNGAVPVRSLTVKAGEETIAALTELFAQLRAEGVDGLYVWQGTVTPKQQRQALVLQTRELMSNHFPEDAVQAAKERLSLLDSREYLQEYTVEIRQMDHHTQRPVECALEETPQGQRLLQLSWRYGFVRSSREFPFKFRYVGKAHATAMTYLDLDLKEYLEWMHQKRSMVISAGGKPQYLILCQPVTGDYAAMDLPADASYEVSLDNMGYMLAACTL